MTATNETPAFEIVDVKFQYTMNEAASSAGMPGVLYDVVVELQGHTWSSPLLAAHQPETTILAEHYSIVDEANQDFEEWGTEIDEESFPDLYEALDAKIRQDAWDRAWESIGITDEEGLVDAEPGDLIEPEGLGARMCDNIIGQLTTGVAIGGEQIRMLEIAVEGREVP